MQKDYSLLNILQILGKWKRHIIIVTVATAVLTAIVSLMMPNYYKAETSFLATNPALANPVLLRGQDDIGAAFGSDNDIERLFSIANSTEMSTFLIDEFDLFEHYDVNREARNGLNKVHRKLDDLYSTTKQKYGAVNLAIEDKDPEFAVKMVRAARERINLIASNLIKNNQLDLIVGKEKGIVQQRIRLKTISDSLVRVKEKYSIVNSSSQSKIYSELTAETNANLEQEKSRLKVMRRLKMPRDSINKIVAKVSGLESRKKAIDSDVRLLNDGILLVAQLESQQALISSELSQEIERLSKLKNSSVAPYNAVRVIDKEHIPFEKSRPRRSLLVAGLTILAFILMCLLSIFLESTKNVNWKNVYAGRDQ